MRLPSSWPPHGISLSRYAGMAQCGAVARRFSPLQNFTGQRCRGPLQRESCLRGILSCDGEHATPFLWGLQAPKTWWTVRCQMFKCDWLSMSNRGIPSKAAHMGAKGCFHSATQREQEERARARALPAWRAPGNLAPGDSGSIALALPLGRRHPPDRKANDECLGAAWGFHSPRLLCG